MTNTSPTPKSTDPSDFANLSNTELAVIRTDLAQERTDLAKERNRMAGERTLLAWIRTSLAMISFGFGIDRFFAYLDKTQANQDLDAISEERLLGLSFITLGTFGLLAAIINHWQNLKNLDREQYTYTSRWSLAMVVAIVLVFIGLATYFPLITADVKLRDIITFDSQIIRNLVSLTVFGIMLTMGINFSLRDLLAFWKQSDLVLRAQLAVSVLMPAIALLLLWLLHPPNAVIVGLILLAASPGAPLLTKRVQMAGGSFNYGASLQVTLSLSAVLITPIILSISGLIFPVATATVDSLQIATQIALVQLLPLSIGLGLRQVGSEIADEIGDFLTIIANTLFVVLAIFLLVMSLDLISNLGTLPIVLILAIASVSLTIGHFLGGSASETRAAVAIASIARNVGLAIFIAVLNQQTQAIPVILSYLILAALVAFPYSAWMRRQIKASSVDTSIPV
ncbi:MAG: DUF202 domain-containing protein [Pleurocapsa sp. MO_192.B19]|nr:DUF202 domain-containing protein [Pleurocapsa sp. MO_192.B19]